LAQLRMLIGHLPWIGAYHTLCHDDILATASGLPAAEGGPETIAAAGALTGVVANAAEGGDPLAGFHAIGTAIDTLLRAVAEDGAVDYRRAVERDVFEFSRRQSLRSRSWFRDAGFDPDAASVPDYADLIAAG